MMIKDNTARIATTIIDKLAAPCSVSIDSYIITFTLDFH